MGLPPSDYLEHTAASIAFIGEHLESSDDFDKVVPSCPNWTIRDLSVHLGSVAAMVSTIVAARSTQFLATPDSIRNPPQGCSDEELCAWVHDRTSVLLHELEMVPPDAPLWTWGEPSSAMFYLRRMCMEMTVHADDLAAAVGTEWSTPTPIAVDGIDEYLEVILPKVARDVAAGRRRATMPTSDLHIHCLDADGEWYCVIDDGLFTTTKEHRKAAVAWRGPAGDLLRWVWGRQPHTVETLGAIDQSTVWRNLSP